MRKTHITGKQSSELCPYYQLGRPRARHSQAVLRPRADSPPCHLRQLQRPNTSGSDLPHSRTDASSRPSVTCSPPPAGSRISAAPDGAIVPASSAGSSQPPSASLCQRGRRQLLLAASAAAAAAAALASAWAPWPCAAGPIDPAGRQQAPVVDPQDTPSQQAAVPLPGEQRQQQQLQRVSAYGIAFCLVAPQSLPADYFDRYGGGAEASHVGALRRFTSVAEAVAACPPGGEVLVAAGRYPERLVLRSPVTVRSWPQGASVELVWRTSEPYQSTIEVDTGSTAGGGGGGGGSAGGRSSGWSSRAGGADAANGDNGGSGGSIGGAEVVLEGLTVRHASKSVANNYAVYIKSGSPRLVDCDISSSTGAGVGVEGASPQLVGCRIHDCARQGLAIFGSPPGDMDPSMDAGLMYGMSGGVVQGCDVYGNALDGVLVRGGASPDLLDNLIHNNGGVGVNLQDCAGRYEGNTVYDNTRGALAVSALFDLDPGDLAGSNSLRGLMRRGL